MSTRERPSKQDKENQQQDQNETTEEKTPQSSESIDDWLDSFNPENVSNKGQDDEDLSSNLTQQESDPVTEESSEGSRDSISRLDKLLHEFTRNLPKWVDKPWMYVKPAHEGHLKSWYQSWQELILSYASTLTRHIINIYNIQDVHPFSHQISEKQLSIEQLQDIIEKMVSENMAKWLDDDTVRARIYFKTDKEWADIMYQFLLDQGYALDIMTLYDLHQMNQQWSDLPDSELREIIEILIEENKAEWVGSNRDTIQFKV